MIFDAAAFGSNDDQTLEVSFLGLAMTVTRQVATNKSNNL